MAKKKKSVRKPIKMVPKPGVTTDTPLAGRGPAPESVEDTPSDAPVDGQDIPDAPAVVPELSPAQGPDMVMPGDEVGEDETLVLVGGYLVVENKSRVVQPSGKFKASEFTPERLKDIVERGLVARLTTEKKDTITK